MTMSGNDPHNLYAREQFRQLNAADPELWSNRPGEPLVGPDHPLVFSRHDIRGLTRELRLHPTAFCGYEVQKTFENVAVLYRGNWYISGSQGRPFVKLRSATTNGSVMYFPCCSARPSKTVANLRTVTLGTIDTIIVSGGLTKSAASR